MDSQKYLIYIYSLILFIFPNTMNTQRITCPRACDVGYTCAMVRHGNEAPRAGCINMEEAIMLHQALNGGPTGPGSGRRIQTDTGLSQPNVGRGFPQSPRPGDPIPPFPPSPIPGESIPGMNFLGGTGAQQQGFEQRFEQGIGRQPQTFMNPTNMLGPQGMSSMGRPISGQFGNPQGQAGMAGPRFLDPTAGQFGPSADQFGLGAEQFGPSTGQFGPSAGQFAPTAGQFGPAAGQFGPAAGQFGPVGAGTGRPPVGFGPQVDGGHSHTSSASGNRDNTNIDRLGSSHGGGNLRRNNDIQACLTRNAWCPVGYVCRRTPTGESGQLEDRCVLRGSVQQRRRSRMPGSQSVTPGRNSLRSSSPTSSTGFPSWNRQSPRTQAGPMSPSMNRQSEPIGADSTQERRTDQTTPAGIGPIEQSLLARDTILPDLLKKGGVRRQSLSGSRSANRMNIPDNRNQVNQAFRQISPATSPFRAWNTSSTLSNSGRVENNTQTCIPCNDHSDCNYDIFTYCINKIPCVGHVCYQVT